MPHLEELVKHAASFLRQEELKRKGTLEMRVPFLFVLFFRWCETHMDWVARITSIEPFAFFMTVMFSHFQSVINSA